jgi:hypothetical protein
VKKSALFYWIVTGLMGAFMLLASIPDILQLSQAGAIMAHLGYPHYLLPFLGTAKTLGVIAVLAPGVPRLKEWAFAGLGYDLLGALYSHLSVGDGPSGWMPAAIGLLLVSGAYFLYRRRTAPRTSAGGSITISNRNPQARVA